MFNQLLDYTSTPKCLWLLATLFVALCLKHTVNVDIENDEPLCVPIRQDVLMTLAHSCAFVSINLCTASNHHNNTKFLLSPRKFEAIGLIFPKMLDTH